MSSKFSDLKEFNVGGVFDLNTYRGNFRCFLLVFICFLGMWHADIIIFFFDDFFGLPSQEITAGDLRVQKFWAVILGGGEWFVLL